MGTTNTAATTKYGTCTCGAPATHWGRNFGWTNTCDACDVVAAAKFAALLPKPLRTATVRGPNPNDYAHSRDYQDARRGK